MADTGYVPDAGITDILNAWLGISASKMGGGKLRLFQNNVTVGDGTALGALTEATFPGYAAITLAGSSWSAVSVTAHVASSIAATAFAFTCSGGGGAQSMYGAYITDSANSVLLACWNFSSGPFVLVNNGDKITTLPTVTEQSLN